MKVILLKDVEKLGAAGTIQVVKDGFARNYLIPQGFAEMATPGRVKQAEERLQASERRIAKEEEAQRSLAERIEGLRLEMVARVGDQGRLYGSITNQTIAEEISKLLGEEIDRRKVLLDDPIRTVGEHQVTVHLVGRLRPTVTVVVTSEGGEPVEGGEPGAFGEVETTAAADEAESGPAAEVADEMRES